MALVIRTPTAEMTWHLGDPPILIQRMLMETINFVHAGGKELDFIKTHFQNVPLPTHRKTVYWYGDMAKFIAGNFAEWGNNYRSEEYL